MGNVPETRKTRKVLIYKLGILLIVLSTIFYIIPLVIPFLTFSTKVKTIGITGSLVVAEVLFWTGAIFVGKEVASKFRSYLNPKNWRRKRKEDQANEK